jgi:hypothetical protein
LVKAPSFTDLELRRKKITAAHSVFERFKTPFHIFAFKYLPFRNPTFQFLQILGRIAIMAQAAAVYPPLNERPLKNTIVLFDVDETLSKSRLVCQLLYSLITAFGEKILNIIARQT